MNREVPPRLIREGPHFAGYSQVVKFRSASREIPERSRNFLFMSEGKFDPEKGGIF